MFTEQAVVHASQSLTSLSLNTANTTQSQSPKPSQQQNQYQQPRQQQQQQNKYNFHYHHQHHHHSPHHAQHHHHHQDQEVEQHNHNYSNHHYRQNKQVHTLPSSLPTSMETSILRRNSIIEHCSCGLTFKVDKNNISVNAITSSTSLLALNTIYNENPTLIEQSNNQGALTQSQSILQDAQHHQYHQQHSQSSNKYGHNHRQQHARHCHHHQTAITSAVSSAPVTIPRYQPSEPPEIHTHEYFSQESQTQDHTTTITKTTASSSTAALAAPSTLSTSAFTPHAHGCRHSHVHAQTDFSYGQR